MIANNVIALGSTVVFARLLTDYGSLAALVSYFLILAVAGQAMQVATAREGVLGHLGVGAELTATIRSWTQDDARSFTIAMTVVSVLLRHPIAQAVGVKQDRGRRRSGIPAGCLYLELCVLRGALQGVGDYRAVGLSLIGEQATRLVIGGVLAGVGLGVTGAYLGTPMSFVAMTLYCAVRCCGAARARAPRRSRTAGPPCSGCGPHVKRAWAPIAGADRDRRAPEHRHHRRQASLLEPTWPAPTAPPRWPPRC